MKLDRSSRLVHRPSGVVLQTPLLVPSFSSKGFETTTHGRSDAATLLETAAEFLTDAYLVSAYDIHYGLLPPPTELPAGASITFLDSGGYESSGDRDLAAVADAPGTGRSWTVDDHQAVLEGWPPERPSVFVSFDDRRKRMPFEDQVAAARSTLAPHRGQLRDFLIKPETADQRYATRALDAARRNPHLLAEFDIVGVTEKELGPSALDRMEQIATLRRTMDEAGIGLPIHVFGALDPLASCLYFLSGAEIFDGLTWIRYGYQDGRCVYTLNRGVEVYGIHLRDDHIRARTLASNYYELLGLQHKLRVFSATRDFRKLEPHGSLLKEASDALFTRLKEGT